MDNQRQANRGLTGFLVKAFIKNHSEVKNSKARQGYGNLSSITGVIVNVLLFAAKFIIGTFAGSVSIVGDSVNNLSDAGSSVISLVSFKMSSKPADTDHPFGHARIEYISSSVVAVIILFIGFELMKTSIGKILHPSPILFNVAVIIVLVLSILSKIWLYSFYKSLGKRIDSTMLQATAADSLSDVLATAVVLLSGAISHFKGIQLDGYMGIVVAVFITISGIKILKKTFNSILGERPSEALIDQIEDYIRKYGGVVGLHDLVVHDYGPGHIFASVHVEVDSNADILISHDLIDNIERDIALDLGIHMIIHLDPIVTDDPFVNELQQMTERVVKSIDRSLSIHDFRVVKGSTHNNLIFDVLIPNDLEYSESRIQKTIIQKINEIDNSLYVVITIDRSYISSPNQKAMK